MKVLSAIVCQVFALPVFAFTVTVFPNNAKLDINQAILKLIDYQKWHPYSREQLEIAIEPGIYRLSEPIRIPKELSGTSEHPIKIYAIRPGTVWLNGGKVLTKSNLPSSDELRNINTQYRDKIRVYDLVENGIIPAKFQIRGAGESDQPTGNELFFNNQAMPLARWPKTGLAKIANALDGRDGLRFEVADFPKKDWSHESDIWAMGYWYFNWAELYTSVKMSPNQNLFTLANKPVYGMRINQQLYFLNILSELTKSGEWYLDSQKNKIFYWPVEGKNSQILEVSSLENLLKIEGSSNIHISGINFELARGKGISINGGSGNQISQCEIRNIGGLGISISGENNRINNCKIHAIGAGGVTLEGGDRKTLTPGNLAASNNDIYDFNRWNKTSHPAIKIIGVGNSAANNQIHDAPHVGILILGNDNRVEYNEIYKVVQETSDAGAIYMGRDWTQRGNIIRYNYFHDISRQGVSDTIGIYLDDQFSGVEIFGNIFYKVNKPVYIGGGRDNLVMNNVFIESSPALSIDQRGLHSSDNKDLNQNLSKVPYKASQYNKYSHLSNILEDNPGAAKYNKMNDNVILSSICIDKKEPNIDIEYKNNICDSVSKNYLPFNYLKINNLKSKNIQIPDKFSPIPVDKIGIEKIVH